MSDWNRRSVMAVGATLTAGGLLLSAGGTGAENEGATDDLEESDGWSSYRGGPGNAGYLPIDGEFEEPDTVAWEYEETGTLAVVGGTVYLNVGDEIHALDETDGSVEWQTDVDGASGTPAVAGGALYVGGDRLTALEANSGEIEWTTDLAAESTTVAYGKVFARAGETVYAIDPDTGEVDWDRETVEMETDDESELQEHTVSAIVASDSLVHARTASTESDVTGLAAFDPETGETAWTWFPTEDPDYPDEKFGGLMARDGWVYAVVDAIGGGGGPVLDAETGERIHGGRTELTPAVGEEAWIATSDVGFFAYEPAGDRMWGESGATLQWSPASIVGKTVVAIKAGRGHDSNTELVGFDVSTGDERWTVEMEFDDRETGGILVAPILSENTVYVRPERSVHTDDKIVALRSSDEGDESDDEDGTDCPADDTDCPDEDPGDDEGGSGGNDDDDGAVGDDDDGNAGNGDDGNGGAENGDAGDETGDTGDDTDADDVPGFTTGAGLVGGAATLEWLRRKAAVDEPAE